MNLSKNICDSVIMLMLNKKKKKRLAYLIIAKHFIQNTSFYALIWFGFNDLRVSE